MNFFGIIFQDLRRDYGYPSDVIDPGNVVYENLFPGYAFFLAW